MEHASRTAGPSPWFLAAALIVPLAGLALMLGFPSLDVHWEHHPSHFWLVFGVALLNVALGLIVSEVARRSGDERLFLVSMVLLTSAGFLALHALATPGVVLDGPNGGFVLATPAGLILASAFAALSAIEMDERTESTLRRLQAPMRVGLVVVLIVWATASVAGFGPLDRVIESERAPWLLVLLPFAVAAYLFAAWRYLRIYRTRRRPLPLAVAVAFVFLAEALIAMAFGRAWQASWWEWHVLMAIAFATIVLAARHEYRHARTASGTFGGIYLERTLERLDHRQSAALAELVRADASGTLGSTGEELRQQGFTGDQVAVMTDSARELARMDRLLRQYVSPHLADRLDAEPELAQLGGQEQEVTVLFADLSGFTTFSEDRPAAEVIEMLNAYWGVVVPFVVDEEGGLIERFAGDAVLAVFNALGDQPDHAARAVRAAIAIRDRSTEVRASEDWPRFRVGVNTGVAVIGNVGAGSQRSFSVIGDTTNVAARLQTLSTPGHITIAGRTLDEVNTEPDVIVDVRPMGLADLKGKREPTEAFELLSVSAAHDDQR
ncbi:MAG TPA: adenylate/guanylate cyclase domain-containing protein [Actinomycetota bacterium]|nr:adenylate/guanylate cyclase domain-containing protein [Actinomycetota bacterium]